MEARELFLSRKICMYLYYIVRVYYGCVIIENDNGYTEV